MGQAVADLASYADDSDAYGRYRDRLKAPNDQLTQDTLAPLEHEQFVRETTARNPLVGTAVTAAAFPYAASKALGFAPGGTGEAKTSRASTDEIGAALHGYVGGLKQYASSELGVGRSSDESAAADAGVTARTPASEIMSGKKGKSGVTYTPSRLLEIIKSLQKK